MRANESRLRNSIARAEAAAKARAEKEAREAQAVRNKQQEASRKGTTYKPTENERSPDVPYRRPQLPAWSGLLARSRYDPASLWRTVAG